MNRRELEPLLDKGGMPKDLGVRFTELEPERVEATMPVDDRHLQPVGFLHGGVSVVLAESVATVGAWLNCPPGKGAFGSEVSASHLRPKRKGTMLTAVGMPVHVGHNGQVWQVRISDENDKPVCLSRCTLAVVDLET